MGKKGRAQRNGVGLQAQIVRAGAADHDEAADAAVDHGLPIGKTLRQPRDQTI